MTPDPKHDICQAEIDEEIRELEEEDYERNWKREQIDEALERRDYR